MLFRGDAGSGLWRSDNGAETWQALGASLTTSSDIEFHPDIPGLLWVSDANGKVLMSGDHGANFVEVFAVPGKSNASGLAFDVTDGSLLVGTTSKSAWEIPDVTPYAMFGNGSPGTGGIVPRHYHSGGLPQVGNSGWGLTVDQTVGGAPAFMMIGTAVLGAPVFGGTLLVRNPVFIGSVPTTGMPGVAGTGASVGSVRIPNAPRFAGAELITQALVIDTGAAHPSGVVFSNGLRTTIIP